MKLTSYMKNKLLGLFAFCSLLFSCDDQPKKTNSSKKESIKTVFYNVENLFDTKNAIKKSDQDFTPDGLYKWTETKYQQKLSNISKTLNTLEADIIGIAEVENKQVLQDLVKNLTYANLKIVHYESHDIRGIDVALLYNPEKLTLDKDEELTARLDQGGYAGSRNILKTTFEENDLVVYVNHWPSRRGGKEKNRLAYAKKLASDISASNDENVVIMGDFNDTPINTSLQNLISETKLINPFEKLANKGKGSATFRQKWYLFDQIMYKSTSDYELKNYDIENLNPLINSYGGKYKGHPLRSFSNNKFQKSGSSDHFPVSLTLVEK